MKKKGTVVLLLLLIGAYFPVFAGGQGESSGSGGKAPVTLEFVQWWEEQVTPGVFRQLMDQFEAENPGIKVQLNSGPYANTKEHIITGAATRTLPDVMGLDGSWVNELANQKAIANLSDLMKQYNYDDSDLADQTRINGSTYCIPVVNFMYVLFVNKGLMGSAAEPKTWSDFLNITKAVTNPSKNVYGWILPISLETPNGIQNDVMSWLWASGGNMLKNGKADLLNPNVRKTVQFIKDMYDAGVIAPGAFNTKEQDKVEQFRNGHVATMSGTVAFVNVIREANKNLDFDLISTPVADGYTGKSGILYAYWGGGISETTKNKAEAWKLLSFLLREDINSRLSTGSNSFPGNKKSTPDYIKSDPLAAKAFKIFQDNYLINEFTGLPVAENLMRVFDEELQLTLEGRQDIDTMLKKTQAEWDKVLK
jgi:multiple sugar transport system substrate-binding protein